MFEYFDHLDNQKKKHSTHTKDKPSTSMIITKNLLSFIYTKLTKPLFHDNNWIKSSFLSNSLCTRQWTIRENYPRESVHQM